jgi:hypothetical protein
MSDPYDDETTGDDYQPQVEDENPLKEFWDDYVKEKPQEAGKVIETLQDLDDSFKGELSNPKAFRGFVEAVEIGEFDKAYPIAVKLKATNPEATWIQAYGMAVQLLLSEAEKRNSAGGSNPPAATSIPSGRKTGKKKAKKDTVDKIWNDDEFANEVMNSMFK